MPLSPDEIRRRLRKEGYLETEGARHTKFTKDGVSLSVPRHKKDLKRGTYKAIIKAAGWKDVQ
jgi:predicted RNA binding protein YcfA (HicA-like mRNA interferase family)